MVVPRQGTWPTHPCSVRAPQVYLNHAHVFCVCPGALGRRRTSGRALQSLDVLGLPARLHRTRLLSVWDRSRGRRGPRSTRARAFAINRYSQILGVKCTLFAFDLDKAHQYYKDVAGAVSVTVGQGSSEDMVKLKESHPGRLPGFDLFRVTRRL